MSSILSEFFSTGVIIAGLQITIAIVGDFQGGRLIEYVECVEKQYNQSNMTLPDNSTFPVSYVPQVYR